MCAREVSTPKSANVAPGTMRQRSLAITSADRNAIGMYSRFSEETFGMSR